MMISRSKIQTTLVTAMALVMVLTSVATAMGQMRAAAIGEMVLCTGHGPRIVQVDAEGQPVQARTTCPDCVLSDALITPPSTSIAESFDFVASDFLGLATPDLRGVARDYAHASRAPPRA